MKKNPYNIWRETIKYFNTKINQEVTRREFFGNVKRFGSFSLDSRDTYRLLLQKAGYLKTVGRGKYLVLKEIPNVSLTMVENFIHQYYQPMGWLPFWGSLDPLTEYRRRNGKGHNKSS
jgi:hypothetical protein